MRVEQQNANIVDKLKQNIGPESTENAFLTQAAAKGAFFFAEKTEQTEHTQSVNLKDATYLKPKSEEKKSAVESYEQGSALDAAERKNQMVVLANTTSAEDYAAMQENGFSLDETSSNTIVTETDKIKAQLAKAGVDISFFGDDLSMEQLEEITGSTELAARLAGEMQQADIPYTQENVKDAAETLKMAGSLKKPSEGAVKYLVDNQLPPTVQNLYKAEYSSCAPSEGVSVDTGALRGQVEQIIGQSGLAVNDTTLAESEWMLGNSIPLNKENLTYVHALNSLELPADEQTLLKGIAVAIVEGGRPQDALLLPEYSMRAQADEAYNTLQQATDEDLGYLADHGMDLTIQNLSYAIAARGTEGGAADAHTQDDGGQESYTRSGLAILTARRQLEEARLAMTAEANYALLKRGIQIDTQPLAQLVDELKAVENSYYENLLRGQGVETSGENISMLRETTEKVADLKSAPAYVLGMREIRTASIDEVHTRAEELREAFLRANERYETLMTAPRADLGDSIQKAFRNVDDILADIGLDTTEANRRAVRILGYNELPVTPEAVAEIKAADEDVQRTFRKLTPATVIEMIRRDINPLDMDFASVNEAAEQIAAETDAQDSRKFGEFLWKLEQDHAISEEERDSYIGTYRLIHQVEQTDGAVIGALLHQGTDITMRNLMMAVRNARHSGKMDYTVDDSFGESTHGGGFTGSITEQMETAYQKNCLKDVTDTLTPHRMKQLMREDAWEQLTPEQLKEALQQTDGGAEEAAADAAYAREQLARLTQSANVTEDIYAVLEKYDMPNTMSNVLAMEAMLKDRNGMFRQIFGKGVKDAGEEIDSDDLEEMKQEVLEAFGEAVSAPEEMAEAQERLGVLAENVMRGMIEKDGVTSIDVREMRLLSAQLSISSTFAKKEQYSVPVMTGDGVVSVSLKIVRGVDRKGVVDITMESALRGKIAATFHAKEQGVTGLIAAENEETRALLEQHGEELMEGLAGENITDIRYAHIEDLDLNRFGSLESAADAREALADGETYQVQTARLYQIAETFIRQIREVL